VSPVEVIAAIRTRLDNATPGPWRVLRHCGNAGCAVCDVYAGWSLMDATGVGCVATVDKGEAGTQADVRFLVRATDDMARLLAVAEAAVRAVATKRALTEVVMCRTGYTGDYRTWLAEIYNPASDAERDARAALVAAVAGLGDGVPEP
jgi:hypothetical protein